MDPILKKQIEEAAARNKQREQEEREEQEELAKLQAEKAKRNAEIAASALSSADQSAASKAGDEEEGKKAGGDGDEEDEGGVCTFFKARKMPGAGLRKRAGKPLAASTKDLKKPKHDNEVATLDSYESTRSAEAAVPKSAMATAVLETETERDRDATAIAERVKKERAKQAAGGPDKVYRGQAAYTQYIDPGDTSGQIKGAGIRAGPVRASLYARAITRWDYQPDICKDYKETGYCGFGDACKFMHDRGDYKSGWELERDWNAEQAKKAAAGVQGEEETEEKDDEDIPFACYVCRKPFTDPVKTKCGHFFCEKCALKKCKVECQVCAQKTGAAFSMPTRAERKKLEDARKKHEANPNKSDDDEEAAE